MTTVNPAAVDIARARQQLAEAEERAEQIRRQVEQQQAEEAAARVRRLEQFDRQFVAAYPAREEAAHAEEKRAYEEFRAAVLADPFVAACIKHRAGRERRTFLRMEVQNAMNRSSIDGPRPTDLSYVTPRLLEDVLDFAEKEARRIVADEMAEHHDRREAVGNGDSA
ncbi:MAG: hypothetical protein M3Q22_10080 [Actinomycetota bacterium]|nr:hypothetical protein [Actinomycetota bacterium]